MERKLISLVGKETLSCMSGISLFSTRPSTKRKNGRRPKSGFIQRLCKYPTDPNIVKQAIEHIYEAHAPRLSFCLPHSSIHKNMEKNLSLKPYLRSYLVYQGKGYPILTYLRDFMCSGDTLTARWKLMVARHFFGIPLKC